MCPVNCKIILTDTWDSNEFMFFYKKNCNNKHLCSKPVLRCTFVKRFGPIWRMHLWCCTNKQIVASFTILSWFLKLEVVRTNITFHQLPRDPDQLLNNIALWACGVMLFMVKMMAMVMIMVLLRKMIVMVIVGRSHNCRPQFPICGTKGGNVLSGTFRPEHRIAWNFGTFCTAPRKAWNLCREVIGVIICLKIDRREHFCQYQWNWCHRNCSKS